MIAFDEDGHRGSRYVEDRELALGFGELTDDLILKSWEQGEIGGYEFNVANDLTRVDECTDADKCMDGLNGQNYCSESCGVPPMFVCGINDFDGFSCDCTGCNECAEDCS
eukprot:UN18891